MAIETLLVDDDALVVRTIKRKLPADFVVRTASTVAEAVELLLDRSWPCWLALIDVQLGSDRVAGLDLLDTAARVRPEIRRALVTGSAAVEVRRRAAERTAIIIPKPFEVAQLAPLLDEVRRSAMGQPSRPHPYEACLAHRAKEWGWSRVQTDIVRLSNQPTTSNAAICAHLGIADATLRHHIRLILKRSGKKSVHEVVMMLKDDAIASLLGTP